MVIVFAWMQNINFCNNNNNKNDSFFGFYLRSLVLYLTDRLLKLCPMSIHSKENYYHFHMCWKYSSTGWLSWAELAWYWITDCFFGEPIFGGSFPPVRGWSRNWQNNRITLDLPRILESTHIQFKLAIHSTLDTLQFISTCIWSSL